jgi:chemotaxis protein methyltransferase CheR
MDALREQMQRHALSLNESDFRKISRLAHEHFGLDLSADKQELVAARLTKCVRRLGLTSFAEYYEHVLNDSSGVALESMVDELTTNHTGFFREVRHFDFLSSTVIPQFDGRQIDIWSAACSTGEEPYSIAISMAEHLAADDLQRVRILASDISSNVLQKAERAMYREDRFQGLPYPLLQRYLLRSTRDGGKTYLIRDEIRKMVTFRQINLIRAFSGLPRFAVIFCRNIMIYFDIPTQQDLITRLLLHLEPGGYLFIGHAENLNAIDHPLQYIAPATFRMPMEHNPGRGRSRA